MQDGQENQEHEAGEVAAPRGPRHRKGNTAAMVAVLARWGSQQEAADAAGISVREVRRRMREPDVARRLRLARREHQRQMMGKLADAGFEALATLRELMADDQPVEIRFKCAKELLSAGVHNLDSLATREELDDLQTQFDALQFPDGEPGLDR
jgi:hypothetical protein